MRALVLDTSAFIMGLDPSAIEKSYTVETVERELSLETIAQLRFRLSRDKGNLTVRVPSIGSRTKVNDTSAQLGEKGVLSEADQDVVALALDLKEEGLEPFIVSDDYAVQNLAEHLNLNYGSLANFGIAHKFQWIMYCPACHRRYKHDGNCRVCGTQLRRKVLSRTKVAKRN